MSGAAAVPQPPRAWLAVASAEHVRTGLAQGFMQINHGKAAPLRRLHVGERIAYYSPVEVFGGKDKLQSFTAIGVVLPGEPYQADMGGGFLPFRRNVAWQRGQPALIAPLLDKLSFSAGVKNWGYSLRFGLLQVTAQDLDIIAAAMGAGQG